MQNTFASDAAAERWTASYQTRTIETSHAGLDATLEIRKWKATREYFGLLLLEVRTTEGRVKFERAIIIDTPFGQQTKTMPAYLRWYETDGRKQVEQVITSIFGTM